jgi:chromosome partitioning protein
MVNESTATGPSRAGYVLAIGMQKGGVAKTTNACHLAVALGELGRRVLLWDVDENYGATKAFQIPPDAFFTTMHILSGDSSAEEAVLAFDDDDVDVELPPNVDFIASSRALQSLDRALSSKDKFYNPNECLNPHIDELKRLGRYDYIILDTGPQASPTTRSAYMVSDYFVLSLTPEKLAVDSLPDALEDIANARRPGRNPDLHLLGLILSCMDRRVTLAKRYEDAITERFRQANQEPVKFKTTIGRAAAIDRAAHRGQTLLQAEPSHNVSEQYRKLAREVEQRILTHRATLGRLETAPRAASPAPLAPVPLGVTANA